MSDGRVLLVEDEADLCELMKMYLEKHRFSVSMAGTGQEALDILEAESIDMVVLDIELPDRDGLSICREIREKSTVPVIFVTCRRDVEDISNGLALGADDYVTKPFDPAELVARIQGHLQKRKTFQSLANRERIWRNGRLEIDLFNFEVKLDGCPVSLFSKEMQLLRFFIKHPNQVFSVEEIFEKVWGVGSSSDIKTVYSHIYNLRRKLEQEPDRPELIRTVRGIGYKFVMKPINF